CGFSTVCLFPLGIAEEIQIGLSRQSFMKIRGQVYKKILILYSLHNLFDTAQGDALQVGMRGESIFDSGSSGQNGGKRDTNTIESCASGLLGLQRTRFVSTLLNQRQHMTRFIPVQYAAFVTV
ncbi:hypothetical protein, partial [Paenibacillus graminis]|uniref:hypothetical protein n=1 Tax=Paenibacillus graminis TaxID=189425 RepID=UPI002DBB585F